MQIIKKKLAAESSGFLILVLALATTVGCSSGISDETFAGMTVCAKVWALDIKLQTNGFSEDYTEDIEELWVATNEAINMNSERYGQLTLLISQFRDAVERGDRRQLLDLVAVQGECENLGFGINE